MNDAYTPGPENLPVESFSEFTERVTAEEIDDTQFVLETREKEKNGRTFRFWQKAGIFVLAVAASAAAVTSLIIPLRPTVSETEKRSLTEFPAFSFEALFSGDYFDGISAWFSDTVPFRDTLMSMNAKVQALLGTNTVEMGFNEGVKGDEIPDVPVTPKPGLDDVVPVSPSDVPSESAATEPSEPVETEPAESTEPAPSDVPETSTVPAQPGAIIQKLDAIMIYGNAGYEYYNFVQSTADNYVYAVSLAGARLRGTANVYDMIIPTSIDVTLPDEERQKVSDTVSDQAKAIAYMEGSMTSDVTVVPIFDALKAHRNEYIYFRTDHHWTGLGAYYAYREFCKAKGFTPLELSAYVKRDFDGFLGSFYNDSKMNPALAAYPDVVETFMPPVNTDFLFIDSAGNENRGPVIYDESQNGPSLKYGAFIWGDNPYSVIENKDMSEGPSILLVKESFGNALAPLLCQHYKYVYIMDYRYYNGTVTGLVLQKGIDDVLFCNNVSMTRGASQVQLLADRIG